MIIGAGSSKEAGFPTGLELRDHLARMLSLRFEYGGGQQSGDKQLGSYLRQLAQNDSGRANALLDAARSVARKLPQVTSIDALLSLLNDPNAISIAKMAITVAIAKSEANSAVMQIDMVSMRAGIFLRYRRRGTENSLI